MKDFTVKANEQDYLRVVRYAMMPDKVVFLFRNGQQIIISDDPEKEVQHFKADTPSEAKAMFEYAPRGIPGIIEVLTVEALNPYHRTIYETEVSEAYKNYEAIIRAKWDRVPISKVLDYIDKIGDYADYYDGVAEMGYDDKPMICANWNHDKMKRIGDWIEKFYQGNIEVDWSDEWMRCGDCGKAIRNQANSYIWEASWVWLSDGELVCRECANECLGDILEYYQNKTSRALPSWMTESAEKVGFHCLESDESYCTHFESGFHPGQNDTPKKAIKLAKEILPYKFDYLFVITGVSQFDIHWAMFVRKVEDEDD